MRSGNRALERVDEAGLVMNTDAIIECVPNFSEGSDGEKVREIIGAMKVDGVQLLDWSMDAAHNRSVVTIAGAPDAVVEAAVRAVGKAAQLIDLTRQSGVHPRIGAADVVPFVPVSGISLAECAMLARQAGLQIWRRYGVPVYFYGAAAARPDRVQLEDVRRGQFEGLREASLRDAARRPDVGGPELHPVAGASAVGARSFLIAYNLYIQQPSESASYQASERWRVRFGRRPFARCCSQQWRALGRAAATGYCRGARDCARIARFERWSAWCQGAGDGRRRTCAAQHEYHRLSLHADACGL
jgi:glutamate formiminotransferase